MELFLSKISGGGEVSGIPRGEMFVDTAAAGGGVDIIHLLSTRVQQDAAVKIQQDAAVRIQRLDATLAGSRHHTR